MGPLCSQTDKEARMPRDKVILHDDFSTACAPGEEAPRLPVNSRQADSYVAKIKAPFRRTLSLTRRFVRTEFLWRRPGRAGTAKVKLSIVDGPAGSETERYSQEVTVPGSTNYLSDMLTIDLTVDPVDLQEDAQVWLSLQGPGTGLPILNVKHVQIYAFN